MAFITFAVEIIDESSGTYMNFDYEYEVYEDDDMTRLDVGQIADDLASGVDMELFDTILSNLSIVPTVEHVEMNSD